MPGPWLTPLEAALILLSGLTAGAVNTVVGSGSLLTFPVLLALGYPPVLANVSNTIGLLPGSISGSIGYRRELSGQRGRIIRLGSVSAAGGGIGAILLLALPASSFEAIVVILILIACVIVIAQPRLAGAIRARSRGAATGSMHPSVPVFVAATSLYGGYFGAAQGVILLAMLGVLVDDHPQRLNALKNVLTAILNVAATVVFVLATTVAWEAAILLAIGAIVGGQTGARIGSRLDPTVLRIAIVVVGLIVVVRYALT